MRKEDGERHDVSGCNSRCDPEQQTAVRRPTTLTHNLHIIYRPGSGEAQRGLKERHREHIRASKEPYDQKEDTGETNPFGPTRERLVVGVGDWVAPARGRTVR